MIEVNGKYSSGIIYSDMIEESALIQIYDFLNSPVSENTNPVWMPDVHAGMGVPIGTTFRMRDKIIPSFVGVDIGCGMLTILLGKDSIDFQALDNHIRKFVPFGTGGIHKEIDKLFKECLNELKIEEPDLFD